MRLTRDGVAVLAHDDALADGRPIAKLTADQLPPDILTLTDLLTWAADAPHLILDLELKGEPFRDAAEPLEAAVLAALRAFAAVPRCRVRSFDHRRVKRLRDAEPRLEAAVLVAGNAPVRPESLAWSAGASVYAPDYRFLDQSAVRACHDAGLRVIPWTVNDPRAWETLMAWGVDGITTDDPAALVGYAAVISSFAR